MCWLFAITGWYQWHGARMASWPVAALTAWWRSGRWARLALLSASRCWPATRIEVFSKKFSLLLLIRVLTSYKYSVESVAWSPNGKQIASGSRDYTIKIWDSQSGDCQSTLTGHRYVTPPPLPATTVLSPTAMILQVQCPHTGYLLGHLLGCNSCQWSRSNCRRKVTPYRSLYSVLTIFITAEVQWTHTGHFTLSKRSL